MVDVAGRAASVGGAPTATMTSGSKCNQLADQRKEPFVVPLCAPAVDEKVLAVEVAELLQFLAEKVEERPVGRVIPSSRKHEGDAPHLARRLLGDCPERRT